MKTTMLTDIGRWIFAITFIMGGLLHVTGPQFAAAQVPDFFGYPIFWVYVTGIAQFAFAASAILRKHDQLAGIMLFFMMLVFIFTIHIPTAAAGDFMGVISIMRDTGYAGAALFYAGSVAQDPILAYRPV
ncbi:MAG: DoxX family membrane protein [Calditrichota bacterium]